jgi:hypothetical protein
MGKTRPPSMMRLFLSRFIPLAITLVVSTALLVQARDRSFTAEVASDEGIQVRVEAGKIRDALTIAVSDAVYLSEITAQRLLVEPDSLAFRSGLASDLLTFLGTRAAFDQVAVLGPTGREQIRVDRRAGGVGLVPASDLSDHGSHEHHRQAMDDAGLTWISPVDPQVVAQGGEERGWARLFLDRAVSEEGAGSVLLRFSLRPFLGALLRNHMGRRGQLLLATESGEWLLGPTGMLGGEDG